LKREKNKLDQTTTKKKRDKNKIKKRFPRNKKKLAKENVNYGNN